MAAVGLTCSQVYVKNYTPAILRPHGKGEKPGWLVNTLRSKLIAGAKYGDVEAVFMRMDFLGTELGWEEL